MRDYNSPRDDNFANHHRIRNLDFKMQIIGDQTNSEIFQLFLSSTIEKGKLVKLLEFNKEISLDLQHLRFIITQ